MEVPGASERAESSQSSTAKRGWLALALKAYPRIDEHMLNLVWDYDQAMRKKHGDDYDPAKVLNPQKVDDARLEYYEGPPREHILNEAVIMPVVTEPLCAIEEEC